MLKRKTVTAGDLRILKDQIQDDIMELFENKVISDTVREECLGEIVCRHIDKLIKRFDTN